MIPIPARRVGQRRELGIEGQLTQVSVTSTKLMCLEMNLVNFSSSVTHTPASSSEILTRRMSSLGGIGREAEGDDATRLTRANRGKMFRKSMMKMYQRIDVGCSTKVGFRPSFMLIEERSFSHSDSPIFCTSPPVCGKDQL
jgi:hypothetical protein